MILKVKLIHPDAKMPVYAHPNDAGMDIFSVEDKKLMPGETGLIATGIQIELPEGTEAQIRPRSGLALRHGITLLNSPGTIDEGYRGEIKVIMINHGRETFAVEKGARIAQMVIKPVLKIDIEETTELTVSKRDTGGFGSTGR